MEASEAQGIVTKRELEKKIKNGHAQQAPNPGATGEQVTSAPIAATSPEIPIQDIASPEAIIPQQSETEKSPMGPTNPEPINTPNESNISQFTQPEVPTEKQAA